MDDKLDRTSLVVSDVALISELWRDNQCHTIIAVVMATTPPKKTGLVRKLSSSLASALAARGTISTRLCGGTPAYPTIAEDRPQ